MTDIWRTIGRTLSRRTALVIGAMVVVTAVLALGITQLEFATGQDSFLDEGSDLAVDNERYQSLFGGENMIVLFTADDDKTVADLFTPDNIAQIREIEDELRADENVFGVISPITALQWTEDLVTSGIANNVLARATDRETDPDKIALRETNDVITTQRALAASVGGQDYENPDWVRFLLFENTGFEIADGSTLVAPPDDELVIRESLRGFYPNADNALLGVVLPGNASLQQLEDGQVLVEDAMEGRTFENMAVLVTGTPTFLADINDYLRGGMLTLGALALLLMAVVLIVAFRVRWRLLPLLVVIMGIVWSFALLGLVGLDLTLVTISGLPILIGIGIDFAIQMHARIEEECVVDRDADPFGETMARLGPALLVATIAAIVAFLVMQISEVPMIRDFGVMLAIGISALFVVGAVLPTAVLGLRERRTPTTAAQTDGPIEKTVVFLGSLPQLVVLPLIALAVVVPIVGLILEDGFEIESDPINWANQDTDTIRNARAFEDNTGFATTLGIFIETENEGSNGIFTDEMAAFMHDLALNEVDEHDELVAASSLATTLSYLIAIPGTTPFPPTGLDMLEAYEIAPPDIQALLVADDGNAAQVNLRVGPSGLSDRAVVFDDLDAAIADPGEGRALLPGNADATPAGLATVGVGLLDSITSNRAAFTYLALLTVFIWLLLRWLSVAKALLALVPVLIAVGLTNILVAVLGITLSPITTVSGPLVIATCAEFTVLILARYLEERERGLEPDAAATRASARTGRAFFASALTTACGFAVLIFSALPLLSDFGAVVTLNIVVALLSALIVLPPMVVWVDRRGLLGSHEPAAVSARKGATVAALTGLVAIAAGFFLIMDATDNDDDSVAAAAVGPVGAVATFPPTTTAPPATENPDDGDGAAPPPDTATTLPPGPPERPDTLVTGLLYDAYVEQGADPGVTRCMTDDLVNTTPEADLIALGIANPDGPSEETTALIAAAADNCGMPPEISDAVAVAAGREPAAPPDTATTLPPGPPERPDTLVTGLLYDAYVEQGADPGVTRCMTDDLVNTTPEADLIALGIANPDGPSEETTALIAAAADNCGMPPEISDAVAAANA